MANITALRGSCVAPFFQESKFPDTGGFVLGRYCAPIPGAAADVSCCLPCPATDWIYPDNFQSLADMAGWVNVGGLVLTVFILLSFIFLPTEKTKRQYLNVCLILGIIMMEVGFIIPLGTKPDQCHNQITPNDMTSSMSCAWSGSLIVAGGVSITMWIMIRTISMHLQICWDITPGTRFFYTAQFIGWAASAGLLASALAVSGVSFRFGSACHINHRYSLQSLWGPLMGVAGVSFILQVATFIYCMNVYLRNLRYDSKPSSTTPASPYGGGLPNPQRPPRARAVYKRVTKVLSLQWRGLVICAIMLVDVGFFAVVFVYYDTQTQAALSDFSRLLPWLVCLTTNARPGGAGKDACLDLASHLVVGETVVIATLMLLAVIGIQALLLVGRAGMLTGWVALLRGAATAASPHDLMNLDSHRAPPRRAYEMLAVAPGPSPLLRSPPSALSSPSVRGGWGAGGDWGGEGGKSEFSKEAGEPLTLTSPTSPPPLPPLARSYQSPRMSFSSPRAPSLSRAGFV